MTTNSYFVARDYDLTLRLQELFLEYAALNTKIHNARSSKDVMNEKNLELSLKLKETVNEIGLLVMKMKRIQTNTKLSKKPMQPMPSASPK